MSRQRGRSLAMECRRHAGETDGGNEQRENDESEGVTKVSVGNDEGEQERRGDFQHFSCLPARLKVIAPLDVQCAAQGLRVAFGLVHIFARTRPFPSRVGLP
jgi:hypothetical protein